MTELSKKLKDAAISSEAIILLERGSDEVTQVFLKRQQSNKLQSAKNVICRYKNTIGNAFYMCKLYINLLLFSLIAKMTF